MPRPKHVTGRRPGKITICGYICIQGGEGCASARSSVGKEIGELSKGSQTVRKGQRGLVYRQSDCKEGREGTCLQAVRV